MDSDNDGCLDVVEAGYDDGDTDGLLGDSPVEVDSLGLVISNTSGYVTPEDRDLNGVFDFLEKGSSVTILTNPSSVSIIETRDARYEILYTVDGTVLFQWQVSEDEGVTWADVVDDEVYNGSKTSVLTLTNAPLEFNDYQFKVKLSTPAYECDIDIESLVVLTVLPDNDKDGIADEDDLDDDNDGILDIYEGDGDIDGDGIINSFDLDSDGDGCYDVIESGCVDPDDDGILGISPAKVDGLGVVVDRYIARYDFTGDAEDSSENGFTGMVSGPVLTNDRFGLSNSAYLFDGIDDLISISHDSLLNLDIYDRFSISMWVKPYKMLNFNDIDMSLIGKVEDVNSWVYKYTFENDTSEILFNITSEEDVQVSDTLLLAYLDWYHLVIQKDHDIYTQFVNGDTLVSVYDSTSTKGNESPILIGGLSDNTEMFYGIIDDIIISGDYGFCNYGEPEDSDNSGVYDFLEYGGPASLDSISESQIITEESDTYFAVSASAISNISYQWQYSDNQGFTWINISESPMYDGENIDTLKVISAPLSIDNRLFRVVISTHSFNCGDDIITNSLELTVLPDNDLDGIADSDDIDDDNDGIFDYQEGNGDSDGDGIPNSFDLDSDGDGCNDVIEAGFTDPEGDGILGAEPVEVDEQGKVISAGEGNGYTDPVDRDSNFKPDYLDFGSSVSIIVEPEDVYIVESLDSLVQVITEVTNSETMVLYTWQVSENDGITWEALSNVSNILEVINADVSYNDRLFRVVVSTPSYICGGEVISDPFRIMIENDFDSDFVGDYTDFDDDNDGIYDSVECESTSSILISGDVDTLVTSGYPIIANSQEIQDLEKGHRSLEIISMFLCL